MKHRIRVYEMKRVLSQKPGSAPQWVEQPAFMMDLHVDADSIDGARELARSLVHAKTGRKPRSLNCVQGGGFSAIVPVG